MANVRCNRPYCIDIRFNAIQTYCINIWFNAMQSIASILGLLQHNLFADILYCICFYLLK